MFKLEGFFPNIITLKNGYTQIYDYTYIIICFYQSLLFAPLLMNLIILIFDLIFFQYMFF